MEYSIAMWLLAAFALAMPVWLVTVGKLHPLRDYFFFFLWGQIFIYLHVAPCLWFSQVSYDLRAEYVLVSAECVLFFEIPLFWIYLRRRRQFAPQFHWRFSAALIDSKRHVLFLLGAMVFAGMFLQASIAGGVLFFRYGSLLNTLKLLSLPDFDYYVVRLFQLTGVGLICLCLSLYLLAPSRRRRLASLVALSCVSGVFLLQRATNSRADVILFIVIAIGVFLLIRRITQISPRAMGLGVLTLLLLSYGYTVAQNVRYTFDELTGYQWSMLNPFLDVGPPAELPLPFRLNGIDLMAEMTPRLRREGFALGAAWEGATEVYFKSFLGRSAVHEEKLSLVASPKLYLLNTYTDLRALEGSDYVSCMLTDAYGNFGVFGLLLAAGLLAFTYAWVTKSISAPRSGIIFIAALFVAYHVAPFEQEFSTLLFGWLRILPVVLVLLVLNPFKQFRFEEVRRAPVPEGPMRTRPRSVVP